MFAEIGLVFLTALSIIVFLIKRSLSSNMHLNRCTALQNASFHHIEALRKERLESGPNRSSVANQFSWMNKFAPCFPINGKNVTVLNEPCEFHEMLKLQSRKARKRILLASLYLGDGHLEHELVNSIATACEKAKERSSDLKVSFLFDYTRGSRGKSNSRTMLLPLLKKYPDIVKFSLYHTPDLRGFLKKFVPDRWNETIGLTHIKVYLFDDSVIISGANLSDSYFTNRQDRYIMFNNCTELADFFERLVSGVSKFSLRLNQDNTVSLPDDWDIHPVEGSDDGSRFKLAAQKCINNVLQTGGPSENGCGNQEDDSSKLVNKHESSEEQPDTFVYPLVQMGPFGITNDENVTLSLLQLANENDQILLASGYFNLTDHYKDVILQHSVAKYKILMASPEVNGFFGAKGISGSIPTAYVQIAKQFFERVLKHRQETRINLYEYYRKKWTFHVKGLWYYLPNQHLPSLTFVGSPNFGYRSVYRDLECQVAIVTENESLQKQLREEHVKFYKESSLVDQETFERKDRFVPLWVKLVTKIIKNFL